MVDRAAILPNMEVLGSDGVLIGRVGGIEGEVLRLSGADSPGGMPQSVPLSAIGRVDRHVHLNVPGSGAAGAAAASHTNTIPTGAAAASLGAGAVTGPASASAGSSSSSGSAAPHLPPVRNPAVENARPRSNYYLPWVLGALLLLTLLIVGINSCDRGTDETADAARTERVGEETSPRTTTRRYAEGTIAHELDRFLASGEPAPRTLIFERLNFDTGSAALRAGDAGDLDQIAQVMNAYPGVRSAIIGYTDARGSGRANARLGRQRAEAVMEGLTLRGIAADRLEARSGGEQAPRAENDDEQGRFENRRTELIVLSR